MKGPTAEVLVDPATIVPELLRQTAVTVSAVLSAVLPSASPNWWEELVLPGLTEPQLKLVRTKKICTLPGLDLAALLRVLDKNWHVVAEQLALAAEVRNYLYEVRSIRNRWAHPPVAGFSMKDIYRDLDTLHRFLEPMGARREVIAQLEQAMEAIARHLHPAPADIHGAAETSRLERLLDQCERDTGKFLGTGAAKRLANWRNYQGNQQQLVNFIQRLIRGPKKSNGRILDQKGGLSLERIVIENPQYFTHDDVRTAKETLAPTVIIFGRSQAS